jgi:hypothetical protein
MYVWNTTVKKTFKNYIREASNPIHSLMDNFHNGLIFDLVKNQIQVRTF